MKKLSIIIFYWTFLALFVFSQSSRESFRVNMEDNWRDNQPNLESKEDVERLFFGDFNAPVEFFYAPSFHGPRGFRIVRDSLGSSYILEVKYISNFAEATREARSRHPSISVGLGEGTEETRRHNNEAWAKQHEVRLQLSEVETLSFSISQLFFEKLQEKKKMLISTFEEENPFPDPIVFCPIWNDYVEIVIISFDGYSVTFRTVVNDEVWSLWIHGPQNRALELSTLFRQMIEDAKVGEFDEERYMDILSAM